MGQRSYRKLVVAGVRPAQLLVSLTVTLVAVSGCAAGGSSGRTAGPASSLPSASVSAASPVASQAVPSAAPRKAKAALTGTPSAVVTSTPSAAAVHAISPLPTKTAVQPATWSRPDKSLKAAPAAVTGAVGPTQQVRVVRLADVKGRPVITVTTSVGPKAAEAAVQSAQQAPGSVAVSVDQRVGALTQPQSNDTYRAQQWALTRLSAEDTWTHSTGPPSITVGFIVATECYR